MTIYQITDWDGNFENDRSRNRDHCRAVFLPNKQHGLGFSYMMAQKDGAALYGIWVMICAACSQQMLPREGWLTTNGKLSGTPWGVADLALKFRRPEAEVRRCIEFVRSPKLGWMRIAEVVDGKEVPSAHAAVTDEPPPGHPQVTADSPPSHPEWKGKEGKENEWKEEKGPLQLRAEKLMKRRPDQPLTPGEERAFKTSRAAIKATTEEEWVALEKFYAAPQGETFARKDLVTLLHNWNGEIDRAKAWLANPPLALTVKVPLHEQLKALEKLIAANPCNKQSPKHTGNETDEQYMEYKKLLADRDAVTRKIAGGGK